MHKNEKKVPHEDWTKGKKASHVFSMPKAYKAHIIMRPIVSSPDLLSVILQNTKNLKTIYICDWNQLDKNKRFLK